MSWIAQIFECDSVLTRTRNYRTGEVEGIWEFVGVKPSPDIAAYAYKVISRQLLNARWKFIETECIGEGRTVKSQRADLFCLGWIHTARMIIRSENKRSDEMTALIKTWTERRWSKLTDLDSMDRTAQLDKDQQYLDDLNAGREAGESAYLYDGVDNEEILKLNGTKAIGMVA